MPSAAAKRRRIESMYDALRPQSPKIDGDVYVASKDRGGPMVDGRLSTPGPATPGEQQIDPEVAAAARRANDAIDDYYTNSILRGAGGPPQLSGYSGNFGYTGSGTPMAPLDAATEQRLAAMKQPTSPSGPYAATLRPGDNSADPRWANLAASMPPAAADRGTPRRDTDINPTEYETERAKMQQSTAKYTGKTPDELRAMASPAAKAAHEAGAANLAAGQAARPQVAQNEQANALTRRGRLNGTPINPLTASLFVGAGLNGPAVPNDVALSTGAIPLGTFTRNPQMAALFPREAADELRAAAYGTGQRAQTDIEQKKLAAEQGRQKAELIRGDMEAKQTQLQQRYAAATTLEERAFYEGEIRRVQEAARRDMALALGLTGDLGSSITTPVGVYQPPVVGGQIASTGSGAGSLDASTQAGRQHMQQQQVPTPSDMARFRPFPGGSNLDMAAETPPPGPAQQGTEAAKEYDRRGQVVAQYVDPLVAEIKQNPYSNFWSSGMMSEPMRHKMLYDQLKQKYPNYPDGVIRYSIALATGNEDLVRNDPKWQAILNETVNPATLNSLY